MYLEETVMSLIKVVLIDDHAMVIEGLRQFLDTCPDITIIGTASTADSGLALIKNTNPRVKIDQAIKFFWGPLTILALLAVLLALMGR